MLKTELLTPSKALKRLMLLVDLEELARPTQSELAARVGTTPGLLNGLLKEMEGAGLLAAERMSYKQVTYRLTPAGRSERSRLSEQLLAEREQVSQFAGQMARYAGLNHLRVAAVDMIPARIAELAQALGLLDAPLETRLFVSGEEAIEQLEQFELCIVGSVPAYVGRLLGEDYRIVGELSGASHALISREAETSEQLAGQTVTIPAGHSVSAQLIRRSTPSARVAVDEQLLAGRSRPAHLVLWEPYLSQWLARDPAYRVVCDFSQGRRTASLALVANPAFAARTQALEQVLSALERAVAAIDRRRPEAVRAYAQLYQMPEAVIDRALSRVHLRLDRRDDPVNLSD